MLRNLRRVLGLATGALSFGYLIFVLNPVQMASAGLFPFSKRALRGVNRWCARSIWGLWVLMAERLNGIELRFTGDRMPRRENTLILPNHQTMADVLAILCLGWRCGRIGDLKWFVKDVVKYFPGFGWGMKFLDCIFVKRNWERDRAGLGRLFDKYRAEQIPIALVSFLEGTRLTPDKLASARAFALQRGLPVPSRTLVPRTKGFVATMLGLRDHLDAVYDVTIGYPVRTPTVVDCFSALVGRIDVHVRRFPVRDLPTDEEALARWAVERFREKDELLAGFAEHGCFPGEPHPERVRLADWFASESHPRWDAARTEPAG